ncbi:hypothetical protein GE061_003019 [Apolygus lucorum]|uniref:Uncharacterized protein n=1 Tax=Apolygus lucorum TaxID=248454 RepID=A0A6A4J417_APOLU|nr:hypothetical protein GE061_003019 [Apolygus lucorum]
MAKCGVCASGFAHNAFRLTCEKCNLVFHIKCVNIAKADYSYMMDNKKPYFCPSCSKERRMSRVIGAPSEADKQVELLNVIEEIREDIRTSNRQLQEEIERQASEINDLKVHLSTYSDYIESNKQSLDRVDSSLKALADKVDNVVDCQKGYDKKLEELTEMINNVDQQARESTVEISGYPEAENENVLEIVKKIGDAVNFPISEQMLDDCYRIKPRNPRIGFPGMIIVSFVRKLDKKGFYSAAWKMKDFNTRNVGFLLGEPSRIYVNNSLTQYNRKLLGACKEFKRKNNFKFVWVRNGCIFLKLSEDSQRIHVKSHGALQQLSK